MVRPEDAIEGPITRLQLWYRFQPVHKGYTAFYILTKVALLAALIYFVHGNSLLE